MAKKLDDLIIGLQLQTKALEDGLNNVKKKLDKHSRDVRNAGKGYTELSLAAGVAFSKIVDAISTGIDTFNEYRAAAIGLQTIVEGTGNSFSRAQQFIEEYTKDGLIPAADAATALKNLLTRGYTQTQAEDVMKRLKDSAAFGRQAALSLGEAVRSATEGLKNENSILVDNAGVTKNVSIMWKEYAETLGKSVNDLTTAEKIQAEYNGIMKETQHQVGEAAKLASEFAGAQSRNAKAVKDLSAAFGESLIPTLQPLLNLFTSIVNGMTSIMKSSPGLASAIVTTITAFLGLVTAFTSVSAAIKVLAPALAALKTSFAGLLVNPAVLAFTALAGAAAYVTVEVSKAKKAQEEFNAAVEKYNRIRSEGIAQVEVEQIKEEAESLRKLISTYEKLMAEFEKVRATTFRPDLPYLDLEEAADNLGISIDDLARGFEKFGLTVDLVNGDIEEAKQLYKDLAIAIDEASLKTGEQLNTLAREIAQKNANIQATKNLIEIYKTAEKGSSEWLDAEKKLAEQFPQFSTAAGIKIEAIENVTKAQEDAIKVEWSMLQAEIQMTKIRVQSLLTEKEALLATAEAERSALMGPGDVRHYARTGMPEAIRQKVEETNKAIEANKRAVDELKNSLAIMDELLGAGMDDVTGITPVRTEAKLKAYENAALESALRILNHKKRMNQLTLEDELKTLEEISRKYVKTAEERMDMDERIYEVRQAIIERDKRNEEEALQASYEAIQKRTRASLEWIESKKVYNELSVQEEIAAYDRIIAYHKEYLNKLLEGRKELSEQEQEIREEEERQIRDFERKKYEIQKSYQEELQQSTIEDINALSAGIQSALRKRYEAEKKFREKALDEDKELLDEWRDAELNRIKTVYNARIDAIKETSKQQKKAIQEEIEALDRQVEERDRAQIDAAELQKINALKERIQYEHDERNKLALQKELDKLQQERQERLFKQSIEDHKAALKQQIKDLEEQAEREIDILEQQKDYELNRIQTLYETEREAIENRLEAWRNYYEERLSAANLQAEAEKMIFANNQKDIIDLLKGYGEDYKLAGQTLGEKLYEGFKYHIDAIRSLIANITNEINNARFLALEETAKMAATTAKAGSTTDKQPTQVSVNQEFNFLETSYSPSEIARKNLQVSRQLAQELGLG